MRSGRLLLTIAVIVFIIPQVTFAAWWNPFTWKIFSKAKTTQTEVQKIVPTSNVEKPRGDIEELKKKPAIPAVAPSNKLTNPQIIAKVKPAIVYIKTLDGAGSGMIFTTDGYVLTNAHVVKGYSTADISLPSGETFLGTVVGRDEEADLSVIKITQQKTFPKVDFGDSSKTEQGDEVFALGFPFGIKGDVSFKEGTISRRIEGYFETSAEIHPGNSGGPLVSRDGQVIGINTAIYGKTVSGIQFGETIKLAIPINIAKNLIADLTAGRNIVVESREKKQTKQDALAICKKFKGEFIEFDNEYQTIWPIRLELLTDFTEIMKIRDFDYAYHKALGMRNSFYAKINQLETRTNDLKLFSFGLKELAGVKSNTEKYGDAYREIIDTIIQSLSYFSNENYVYIGGTKILPMSNIETGRSLFNDVANKEKESRQFSDNITQEYKKVKMVFDQLSRESNCIE